MRCLEPVYTLFSHLLTLVSTPSRAHAWLKAEPLAGQLTGTCGRQQSLLSLIE